jgi:RNA polymerase sigma factor (sigma-70 family)
MATKTTDGVIPQIRRAVLRQDRTGLTDGQLLGLFIDERDDHAFAILVTRHGPMVWGACRRLLPTPDAEDAFQATFLVLVRKAGSVVPREMVANWLYGVAHHTALQARRSAVRRGKRQFQAPNMPEPAVTDPDPSDDLRSLLDEELSRLPDKYRAVIVMCELEGKTRREVAGQLGVPEGTVAGRLARARAMLAKRLGRRGVSVSGAALAAVLSEGVACAAPISLMPSTIKAASVLAAGTAATAGIVSPTVAALTESVVRAMLISKLKFGAMAALVGALCLGVAGLRAMPPADPPTTTTNAKLVETKVAEGQKPKQPSEPGDKGLRETLLGLEKEGWEALKGKKPEAKTTLADDFVAVMADDGRLNRADFLKLLADVTLTDYSVSDVALTRLTPDAAVWTYKVRTDYTYKGETTKETIWVSSAWAKRDGNWVNVLYQETRVKK